ncbi:hypothetical protein V1281_005812 [Nitrobacteraceae bacterium AZCC 2161]
MLQPPEQLELPPVIPPPNGDLSDVPDNETKKGLVDFTGPDASNRILFINIGFFKYGTADKAHAGSIFLSLILIVVAFSIMVIGLYSANGAWLEKVLSLVWSAFLFVVGVSIGRGQSDKTD